MSVVVTRAADDDIAEILDRSAERFGQMARRRYSILIEAAIDDLSLDPMRAGSRSWPGLQPGVRTYHLLHSRTRAGKLGGRVGSPRHLIAYLPSASELLIARVLHESMDLARHIPPAIEPDDK